MIYIAILMIILIIYCLVIYNYQINLLNKYERSKSTMDVYLQQRFDLIPNLVSVVKGYTQYENEILEKIILLREKYNENKNLKTAKEIEQQYEQILIRVENYPNLKADMIFKELSKNLVVLENQIQAARRAYNYDTMKYNSLIQIFPNNIISKMLKWREKELFNAEKDAQTVMNINLHR